MRQAIAALALSFMCFSVLPAHAQPSEPIYLEYDGWVKNPNGTYTLWFGYYNANHVDVTIAAGPDNSFAPAPGDRNQPIMFQTGRRRFVCTVVMPKDFDGKLQWTLTFAGKTSTTTARVLDPLYELEAQSLKLATIGFDVAKAKTGACTNRPPIFFATNTSAIDLNPRTVNRPVATFTTHPDQNLFLNGQADDDGLPRYGKVTGSWKRKSGPGTVLFSSPDSMRTWVKFSAPGVYELELSGTDGEASSSAIITVTVTPAT